MKLDILCFAAHPDDIEISCAGTVIKHILQGKKVGVTDLTQGELGSRGNAQTRLEEAKKSSAIMNLKIRENLKMQDGFIEYSETNLRKIISNIRKYKPEVILANSPKDRHPDHGHASKLVRDAAFYSGLIKYKTEANDQQQDPWRPNAVYYYIQDWNLKPDFVVDVSDHIETKFEALLCFRSQFYQENMQGPQTPISGKDFIEFLKGKMRTYGRSIQAEYAEGFICDRIPGINDFMDLY